MDAAPPELVSELSSTSSAINSGNGNNKPLTIRLTSSSSDPGEKSRSPPISPSILLSPQIEISPESSFYNSPSVISPPSSAFVSALQSPYISPRAFIPLENTPTAAQPSPNSNSGSNSGDIPSCSYTPPPEKDQFSDDPTDQKPKIPASLPDPVPPRISFSFPVPRISFTKGSVSPSTAKLRSCDVYIGYHGVNPNLIRFGKWLKSELELQGIACFVADRAKYSDTQSQEIAERIICSATFGVVIVTEATFLNHFSIEEIRIFVQKKNLLPLFFDTDHGEIARFLDWKSDEKQWFCESQDKEWKEAVEGLMKSQEFKLETHDGNWRNCVSRTVGILKSKLGRKNVAEKELELEEIPYPRNRSFIGREKELQEIETLFFGSSNDLDETNHSKPRFSEGLENEEDDSSRTRGRFISLEMRSKEPALEAWIDPVIDLTNRGRNTQKQRSRSKKSQHGNKNCRKSETGVLSNGASGVLCISGVSGTGKTELAFEFAYRFSQRYKTVLWIGGESRYLRQNVLNLSTNLGLDVSAETQQERTNRIKSFEEQEFEAFQRIKRELFRDVPYLLIIDNLEAEKEWWDGKDLHDLIPRNTGATHVIITSRLSKVMNFGSLQLLPLSMADAMVLIKGKKKKGYPTEELDVLRKFEERLGRSSFGLGVIGSLLTEFAISPSALLEAINKIQLTDSPDDHFCKNNPFLMRVLSFCFTVLDQTNRRRNLASRMVLAGAWFAPSPVSVTLLAAAAKKIAINSNAFYFHQWKKCLKMALCCCSNCCLETRKSDSEAALLLVKLGLARKTNKQPGIWIHFHEITRLFAKQKGGLTAAKATARAAMETGNPTTNLDHLWASAFLVFGFKSEPAIVQLKSIELVSFIRKTALPLAIRTFSTFSRCNSALELLKLCTNLLEEIERSFVSQIQDWCQGSLCWKKKLQGDHRIDEYVWRDVTLLKATLLETRAKLLLRGGQFDSGEELCRTCISIRTVMLGHGHVQTLAAQETLARLVRYRSKI